MTTVETTGGGPFVVTGLAAGPTKLACVAGADVGTLHAGSSAIPKIATSATAPRVCRLLIPEGFDGLKPGRPIRRIYPKEETHGR